jgi:hypothetical protein
MGRQAPSMSAPGPSRHFAPPHDFGRKPGIAEVDWQPSIAEGDARDPKRTSGCRLVWRAFRASVAGVANRQCTDGQRIDRHAETRGQSNRLRGTRSAVLCNL